MINTSYGLPNATADTRDIDRTLSCCTRAHELHPHHSGGPVPFPRMGWLPRCRQRGRDDSISPSFLVMCLSPGGILSFDQYDNLHYLIAALSLYTFALITNVLGFPYVYWFCAICATLFYLSLLSILLWNWFAFWLSHPSKFSSHRLLFLCFDYVWIMKIVSLLMCNGNQFFGFFAWTLQPYLHLHQPHAQC